MAQSTPLDGQTAVVTGGTRGIGRAIAKRLANDGARVVVNGRHLEGAEEVVAALRNEGAQALAVAADVGYADQVERLFAAAVDEYGAVDILVNNAAWAIPVVHFLEMDETHWDTVLRTNLKSAYLCSRRAASLMVKQGKQGCIVSISSFGAVRAHRQQAAYDASKSGLEGLTRAIALDLAPFGIRANVVGPGAIHTQAFEPMGRSAKRRRGEVVPLGRVGEPDEVAAAVAFLASNDARYITGQAIYVDGGVLAQLRTPQADAQLPERLQRLAPFISGRSRRTTARREVAE